VKSALIAAGALWLLAQTGCDPQATASGSKAVSDDQVSRVGETCSSSLHCQTGLRCIQQRCVSDKQSRLGDLYAAAGDVAAGKGRNAEAIAHFATAVTRYEKDGVAVPARVLCAQGRALLPDRRDRTKGELAARVLHKCVLEAAPGSRMREQAMRDLALMMDVGLDPEIVGRDRPADTYLTKAPAKPPTENLTLTVAAKGNAPRSRTFSGWLETLQTPDAKAALVPCWEANWKQTNQKRLEVELDLRYSFRLDEYDDFDRSTLDVKGKEGAAACVAEKLAPVADEFSRRGAEARWGAKVVLTLE